MEEEKWLQSSGSSGNRKSSSENRKEGLPPWIATYADMVTLLFAFFVLLFSFAKTEEAQYESVLGSIRNAFGGNILKQGEIIRLGKSPDDKVTNLESQSIIKPFPIDFLTIDGFLDKYEINRASSENVARMKEVLRNFDLLENADIHEMPEGAKIHIKEKILFKQGSTELSQVNSRVFKNLLNLMRTGEWVLFIQGHASKGEVGQSGQVDTFDLSASRTQRVTQSLIERGVQRDKITGVFYGDTRPGDYGKASPSEQARLDRRVDFILRKVDLKEPGFNIIDPREP